MGVKEKALTAASSIASGDFLRMVTSAGVARKIDYSKLAKAIVEEYNGSTIAGSAQTLKAALDSLNSNWEPLSLQEGYTANGLNKVCEIGKLKVLNCTVNADNPQNGDVIAITSICPKSSVMFTINNVTNHTTGYAILYSSGELKGWNMSSSITLCGVYE